MDIHDFLINSIIYLAAAVIGVTIFKRLGLGAVLGYLVSGIVIGPYGLGLIEDVESILHFSEFGVVLLLFVIGLELQPSRLKAFRTQILRSGTLQMSLSSILLFVVLKFGFNLSSVTAAVIAFSLALSSTAFALQTLAEKKQLTTSYGRQSFAILLFQDLAVIPALAILPILSGAGESSLSEALIKFSITIALLIAVVVGGKFLLNPLLRLIARTNLRDVFTAATLLLVFGSAALLEKLGLSMALGAFMAGVLLADSEYRHALEADIEPFKGLLLGLFFIAVGMSVNLQLILERPLFIIGLAIGLISIKFFVLQIVAWQANLTKDSSRRLGLIIPQGGEFAFVLLGVALSANVITQNISEIVIAVVTISMIISPIIYTAYEKFFKQTVVEREADQIESEPEHVIIAGFGRFGQVVARILAVEQIAFTALEKDPAQVDFVRKFGSKIFYGDASRTDLLHAAKAHEARALILAIDDPEESVHAAEIIRSNFPDLTILARARNRQHAFRLMDLNIKVVIRETLDSSLSMTELLLETLGYEETDAISAVKRFKEHDEELLCKQHSIHNDEQALIQSTHDAREELHRLFNADKQKND